ncbi:MAG: hypothetical protein GF409_05170, partial [Candidatus Omnitrophica bacterium]|nr:hypothetical protein [Candidatus Omnitrophota bacterium]
MARSYKEITKPRTFRYKDIRTGESPPRQRRVSPKEEKKQIENIVDFSDVTGVDHSLLEKIYEPVSGVMKAVPDPVDVDMTNQRSSEPAKLEAGKEQEGILNTFLGFKYPPKPPDWKYSSLIEKFNYYTLPIADILGRIGGKIASDWRMMTKEDVQALLVSELEDDLKWFQKTPEAVGWTGEKVAEYLLLKGVFKATGLHKALTVAGQKMAAPFIAKQITRAGGVQTVKTLSAAGIKDLLRKGVQSFLTSSPENVTFISSWSALDAWMKGGDVIEEAKRGAGWGLVLTAGLSMI